MGRYSVSYDGSTVFGDYAAYQDDRDESEDEMINTTSLRNDIRQLGTRYDAGHDIVSGGPPMTYIEMKLLETCRRLLDCIDDLADRVDGLEKEIDYLNAVKR